MGVASFTFYRAAMNFELPPQNRFRMMKTKQCAHQPSPSLNFFTKGPFQDEPRSVMSKIWRLLRCTRAVRRMLRDTKWFILMDEPCFVVKCTHVNFSVAILPFLLSL